MLKIDIPQQPVFAGQYDAECRNVDPGIFFPETENRTALERAQQWCNHCPVVNECLRYAIEHGEIGFWGGHSTAERTAMRRKRTRARCPVCRTVPLTLDEGTDSADQICVSCGSSWNADRPSSRRTVPPVVQPDLRPRIGTRRVDLVAVPEEVL